MKPISSYRLEKDHVVGQVNIYKREQDYVPTYELQMPELETATQAMLDHIRQQLVKHVKVKITEMLNPDSMEDIKQRFLRRAEELIRLQFPSVSENTQLALAGRLVHEMLGLGAIELILADDDLEEIVINNSKEPVWIYHKSIGWLKTNVMIPTDEQIYNYASLIGRKVGRQITNLTPLMDAHLLTGDRVNAVLFPISSHGNNITLRRFARNPWTITHFISPQMNTLSKEVAATVWLAMENELNMIIAGGTASGKTSFLNSIIPFIPPNQRIVSIEDTRELMLPKFLHWVPLTTREKNPEGKGEVSMLDLMVNSLRMRPDRIVLGEIRRQREAEVLFEAMHTGHSVYATLHADNAEQVRRRLISPPIELPESMLEALHLVIVQFRHRSRGVRRTFEFAEIVPQESDNGFRVNVNVLYRWNAKKDKLERAAKNSLFEGSEKTRFFEEISLHTGKNPKEITQDLREKEEILQYMVDNNICTVDGVGRMIAETYRDKDYVLDTVQKKKSPDEIIGKKIAKGIK